MHVGFDAGEESYYKQCLIASRLNAKLFTIMRFSSISWWVTNILNLEHLVHDKLKQKSKYIIGFI